jgi:integrase
MPRRRPPHLQRETSRHGKPCWYVRVAKGRRIRIRVEYGTPEFLAEYQAAISGTPKPAKGAPATGTLATGTLAWLIARYRETTAWLVLSVATRRQRENIFKQVITTSGDKPFRAISLESVIAGRDRRSKTPAQARHFLDAMRGLFRWAKSAGEAKRDPTEGVTNPPQPRGPGFIAWTEDHVAAYWKRWPLGTRQRVWLDVLLYSGLRRGDAVVFGRQHVRNGIASIKTEKSQRTVEVTFPILSVLAKTLETGPTGDLTFITGDHGQPLTKESFGNAFRDACRKAGVPGSAHGVRKIAATTAANNGATEAELDALFGWTGRNMAALYTRTANRRRLGIEAATKLVNAERTSIPAPDGEVRAAERKAT